MKIEEGKVINKIPKILRSQKSWIIAGGIVIFFIGIGLGNNSASVSLDKKKVTYDGLIGEIEKQENELDSLEQEIKSRNDENEAILTKVNENKESFEEAQKIVDNKITILEEIKGLEEQVGTKKNELDTLNSDVETKEAELASVTGQIKEKEEAPKQLSAGKFTVGKDIPAGRYKVVPTGGNGNFFVNGGASVNIMLGKGEFYESEYVFEAFDSDEIELTLSAKFIPVE